MDGITKRMEKKASSAQKHKDAWKKAEAELKEIKKEQARKAAEAKRKADTKAKIEVGGMVMKLLPGCTSVDDLLARMYVQGLRLQDGTSVNVVAIRDVDINALQAAQDSLQ